MTTTATRTTHWLICDGNHRGDYCLFADDRRNAERDRCIRHGAILTPAPSLRGMSRTAARAAIAAAKGGAA